MENILIDVGVNHGKPEKISALTLSSLPLNHTVKANQNDFHL
jgi:hypothetical protein